VKEAFTPLLAKSTNARLIYVSSDLGSITNRSDTSLYYHPVSTVAYRMSKAALNMLAMCNYAELNMKRGGMGRASKYGVSNRDM
jgi:NAD(P)-dependent dehydrogenase (short-subunit alcohol dehydrogenase family)